MTARLREYVYNQIINEIISGDLHEDTVFREKDLVEKYQVSKSPVRDALVELCNEGILKGIARVGYQMVHYDREYYVGIIELRMHLEPYCLSEYWDRLSPDAVERIEEAHRDYLEDPDREQPITFWHHNLNFHVTVAKALYNSYYVEVLRNAINRQKIIFSQFFRRTWDRNFYSRYMDNHLPIIDALRKREKTTAVEKLREDIRSSIEFR